MISSTYQLKPGAHACLFFDGFDEQRLAVLPFLQEGLKNGEQVFYVADEQSADDWLFELQASGIDVERERSKRSLIVCEGEHWRSPNPLNSVQNARESWELIETALTSFSGIRFAIDAGWTLDPPVPDDMVCHWEATINVVNSGDVNVRTLCLYNIRRHSAPRIHAALRTHPIVGIGGAYRTNPYYEADRILENEPHLNHSNANAGLIEGMLLGLSGQPELV